jgi:hypothetical protein
MANSKLQSKKKTTRQGEGKFSKRARAGGQTFIDGHRSGSPPSKFRARRKPTRGQGS